MRFTVMALLLLALFVPHRRETRLQSGPTDAPIVTLPDTNPGGSFIDNWISDVEAIWKRLTTPEPTRWRSGPRG